MALISPFVWKTLLAEALLWKAGVIGAMGSTERGSTVCDHDPLEKQYGHSLSSSLVNFPFKGIHVHLVDTPGMPDFAGQSIAALAAVETAVVVINAQNGIELNTSRMMKAAGKRGLCRMILVNKIDADNVDLEALLRRIQDVYGKECLPINLPAHGRKDVVDCFFNPDGDSDFSSVKSAHSALIDQVVEVDEDLMATYLEQGEELSPEQLHAPFEKALREGALRTAAALDTLAEREAATPLPGYTHQQPAMPSSVPLWAGGFASELRDENAARSWLYRILHNEHARLYERKRLEMVEDQELDALGHDLMGLFPLDVHHEADAAHQLADRQALDLGQLRRGERARAKNLVLVAGGVPHDPVAVIEPEHEAGAAQALLQAMKALPTTGINATQREPLQSAITYFTNHHHQMDYAAALDQHWPIGSGVTEAACKTLVKQRLCCSGMRWKEKGAAVVLSLRALRLTPTAG